MGSNKSNDLIRKYLNADSSIEEEHLLFNSADQSTGLDKWSTYVNSKRQEMPVNLYESIRARILEKQRKKRRFLYGLSGIAASIILLISMNYYNTDDSYSDYREKEALLNKALAMFPADDEMTEEQIILYEDDLIVVFVSDK